jgi:Glycosyl hydrolases family 16
MRAHRIRSVLVASALLGGTFFGVRAGALVHTARVSSATCESTGAARTAFPAAGTWSVVDQETFNGASLPANWDAFRGYFDGGTGQARHSIRESSMLAFPGSWMRFKNQVYSDNDGSGSADADHDSDAGTDSSFYTIADAGTNEAYDDTYNPATGHDEQGYDDASHAWGFQWCARLNGGPGFDTAFAFVPTNNAWPPEIDFIEHGPRDGNTVTLHIHWKATKYNNGNDCDPNYPASNSQNCHANFPRIPLVVGHWNAFAVTWSASEIAVWINGHRINSLTVTPRICTQRADQKDGFGDTGTERLCLPDGYAGNVTSGGLEPFAWDMQQNSYNGTTNYPSDQTDLAWFQALQP